MKCPSCGKNIYSHKQEINKSKTEIVRYYGCRNCHHKFRTVEKIITDLDGIDRRISDVTASRDALIFCDVDIHGRRVTNN